MRVVGDAVVIVISGSTFCYSKCHWMIELVIVAINEEFVERLAVKVADVRNYEACFTRVDDLLHVLLVVVATLRFTIKVNVTQSNGVVTTNFITITTGCHNRFSFDTMVSI